MGKNFSTIVLFHDGSATPAVREVAVAPHRWRSYLNTTSIRIMLAGGFPRLSPNLPFPLSPTLQINQDLTTRCNADLRELAEAELERDSTINCPSLFVDADPRVCVLSESAHALERFLETYGGILEIEPILIKGSHPDFSEAVEASIVADAKGYRVHFTVRVPIEKQLCTYCGECGSACPEACLSERLLIDYSRCTLCRKCEQVCPVQAIDISAVESRSLDIPAVVVLNGASVDLPQEDAGIFTEKSLPELFATVSAVEIQDVIGCDNQICQYAGRLGIGCRRCLDICPHSAITLGTDGVTVNARACRECGACVSVCPTGALQYERFTDRAFYRYFHKVRLSPGSTVIIGSEEALQGFWWRTGTQQRADYLFFLEHPNINAINGMQLLLLFARGARRIVLIEDASPGFDVDLRPREADMVNSLLKSLFGLPDTVVFCNRNEVQNYLETEITHPLTTLFADPVYNGRRPALTAILEHLVLSSGRQIQLEQQSMPWFAVLECDTDRCSQCLACLNECKTVALAAEQSTLALLHTPVRCVACGICVQVCPEDALRIAPDYSLDENFFHCSELARGEAMVCVECGKAFGTKKSYERVAAILARRGKDEHGYLEYCDTCRIAKIFIGN